MRVCVCVCVCVCSGLNNQITQKHINDVSFFFVCLFRAAGTDQLYFNEFQE